MTFQRKTAKKIIELLRSLRARAFRVVVGGYDPSMAPEAYANEKCSSLVDFIVRGEGEITFRELLRAHRNRMSGYERHFGFVLSVDNGRFPSQSRSSGERAGRR